MSFNSTSLINVNIYLLHKPQLAGLIAKKTFMEIFAKYANFADIFSLDLASKLFKHSKINDYAIELVNNQ